MHYRINVRIACTEIIHFDAYALFHHRPGKTSCFLRIFCQRCFGYFNDDLFGGNLTFPQRLQDLFRQLGLNQLNRRKIDMNSRQRHSVFLQANHNSADLPQNLPGHRHNQAGFLGNRYKFCGRQGTQRTFRDPHQGLHSTDLSCFHFIDRLIHHNKFLILQLLFQNFNNFIAPAHAFQHFLITIALFPMMQLRLIYRIFQTVDQAFQTFRAVRIGRNPDHRMQPAAVAVNFKRLIKPSQDIFLQLFHLLWAAAAD